MIEALANFQPILIFILLIGLFSIETIKPYLKSPSNIRAHNLTNLAITAISFVVNGLISLVVVGILQWTEVHKVGIMNLLDDEKIFESVLGIFILDLSGYGMHRLQHKISWLWKFHRIHHSDPHLNSSSSLRFHPVETIYTQGLFYCIVIPVLGISMTSFVIYGTLQLIFIYFQHSNLQMPEAIERYGSLIFSTPGWHKIHHSNDKKYTDSHYGDLFTLWDRIFGTWHKMISPKDIQYGLNEFEQTPRQQTLTYLLKSPFLKLLK